MKGSAWRKSFAPEGSGGTGVGVEKARSGLDAINWMKANSSEDDYSVRRRCERTGGFNYGIFVPSEETVTEQEHVGFVSMCCPQRRRIRRSDRLRRVD
jgi:hypothetical protein